MLLLYHRPGRRNPRGSTMGCYRTSRLLGINMPSKILGMLKLLLRLIRSILILGSILFHSTLGSQLWLNTKDNR